MMPEHETDLTGAGREQPLESTSAPDSTRLQAAKRLQAKLVEIRRDVARSGLDAGVVAEAVEAVRKSW